MQSDRRYHREQLKQLMTLIYNFISKVNCPIFGEICYKYYTRDYGNLKNLTTAQLNKIIDNTQAELSRRKNIDLATAEICAVLKKYKIDFKDIGLNTITATGGKGSTKNPTKGWVRATSAAP